MDEKRILVPVKGDKADEEAMLLACGLAKERRAKVYALYVIEVRRDLPLDAEIPLETAKGETLLQRVESICKEQGCRVEAEIVQAREVGPAVVQEAIERNVDLIVVGMPYKRRFGTSSIGNTVSHILKYAPCQVLVWREEMSSSSNGDTPGHVAALKGHTP